jgi:uncharacterized protein YjiS (DUF1127 family)
MMHPPFAPAQTVDEIARRWNCTTRTIFNLKRLGVDPTDPVAVRNYLLSVRHPSVPMLAASHAFTPSEEIARRIKIREHRAELRRLQSHKLEVTHA